MTCCGSCKERPAARFFRIVQDVEGAFAWCRECCEDQDLMLDHQIEQGVSLEITEEEHTVYEVLET